MPGKREREADSIQAADAAAVTETTVGAVVDNTDESARVTKPMVLLLPAVLVLALLLVCAGFCIAATARDTIAPNTFVGSTDVSALTQEEAADRIAAALDAMRRENGVHALLEDGTEAIYRSYDALDVRFDADALARAAYEESHSGNPIADGWTLLRAMLGTQTDITPVPAEGWTVNAARALAEAAALEPQDFSYELDESNRLYLTKERDGRRVDAAALRAALLNSEPDENGSRSVTLQCTAIPAETGDLAAIDALLGDEMANARFDKETQTILPERMAINFDVAAAQSVLEAAEPGERVSVPTEVSEPEVTAEELRKVLFRDVLGTYTTRVGGAAGRKSNVKLTAARVNGAVLNSGEEFNYYSYTGPFSASNGYQSAPGYLHGKTVEMDGGGACQCSSTTYAAALLANMEIVARTAHGFASDYIGLGLDATVSGGGPDFIFRNNTLYPIKIKTEYSSNNYLTVTIVGTKTDKTYVKMRTNLISTTPYEEETIVDPTLAPGARVVDTTPYTGYLVDTYRQLYDADGNLISETFEARSKYNKRNRIIKVGPAAEEPAVETPVQQPVETPAQQPVETPVQPPVETPVQQPIETPVQQPVEPPVQPPVELPVEPPVQQSTETPAAETPAQQSDETPAETEAAA
ncbi:MAG: VanW family protein [Oscillospiraceae bacterium]|nr:VanW family protein [Oscillospiraceae bacterium]